jgi:carbonic anhydrase
MKELLSQNIFKAENTAKLPSVAKWLNQSRHVRSQLPQNATLKQMAELNSLQQLDNLRGYPSIRRKLEKNEVQLHAWYYNIGEAELEEWDEIKRIFVRVGTKTKRSLQKRIEAGVQYQFPIIDPRNNPDKS